MRTKIADLRELGFADPVKMITSTPAILGYAPERLLLCGKIVMQLRDEEKERMFLQLIKQPRTAIDAVATAQPGTWTEVRAIIAATRGKLKFDHARSPS